METYTPKVSIITAVFNGFPFLEKTIKSILSQSYSSIEYIIIDGNSSDGTLDIIKKYSSQLTYWVSEPDKGIYDAWNKGLAKAGGDWIAFVGAGDILHQQAIETYINELALSRKKVNYISSVVEVVDSQYRPRQSIGSAWEWLKMKKFMNIAHVGSLHSKELFLQYGLFDISYKIAGDYAFFLKIGCRLNALFIEKTLAQMVDGGASTDQRVFAEVLKAKIINKIAPKYILYFQYYIQLIRYSVKSIVYKTTGIAIQLKK